MARPKHHRRHRVPVVVLLVVVTGCVPSDSASTHPPDPSELSARRQEESESSGGTYEARPEDYLSADDMATLRGSSLPVLLPTRLPHWTRGVDPIAFLHEPTGSYFVSWTRRYDESDPLAVTLASDVVLQVTGNYYPPDDPQRLSPGPHGGKRDYFYDDSGCSAEALDNEDPSAHEGAAREATVQYNSTGRSYYLMTFIPGPGCMDGEYTKEDAIAVMDSLESDLVDGGSS